MDNTQVIGFGAALIAVTRLVEFLVVKLGPEKSMMTAEERHNLSYVMTAAGHYTEVSAQLGDSERTLERMERTLNQTATESRDMHRFQAKAEVHQEKMMELIRDIAKIVERMQQKE